MANVVLGLNDLNGNNVVKNVYRTKSESILSLETNKSLIYEVRALNHLGKFDFNQRVQWISEQILRSTSYNVDALDNEAKCVLHLLLDIFIRVGFKHESEFDIVENILFASKINYEEYKDGEVLQLLMRYDVIKYLQWQIINSKDEDFYREFKEQKKEMQNQCVLSDLLEMALAFGAVNIFKYLVDWIHSRYVGPPFECPVLVKAASWSIYVVDDKKEGFYECFDYLLNQHFTNINAEDKNGNTALHYACIYKEEHLIRALLNKKANIDVATLEKGIPSNIFESYLDSLVTCVPEDLSTSGLTKFGEARLKLKYIDDRMIFINLKSFVFCPITYIEVLNYISLHNDYKRFLQHPVLGALQDLTWQMMFWKRLILNTPTMITRILFLIYNYLPAITEAFEINFLRRILFSSIILGKIYLGIYLFEYYKGTQRVNKNFFYTGLLMKLINIWAYAYYEFYLEGEVSHELYTSINMYFAINITLSIGLFSPSVARYNFMLLKILVNALKFLLSISFLIFGFSSSFWLLFGYDFGEIKPKNETSNGTEEIYPTELPTNISYEIPSMNITKSTKNSTVIQYENIVSLSVAFLKTFFTLSSGVSDDNFKYYTYFSCVFLAIFTLVIPLMAVNLLTGLAVGDVYELILHSKFWHRKMQCLMTLSSMWQIRAPNMNKTSPLFRIMDEFLVPFKLQNNLKKMLQDSPTVAVNVRTRKIFACKNLERYNLEELGRLNRSSVTDAIHIIKEKDMDNETKLPIVLDPSTMKDIVIHKCCLNLLNYLRQQQNENLSKKNL